MANACGVAGQTFGAEEYALTALGLACAAGDVHLQAVANTTLALIYRKREQWSDTTACVQKAVELAASVGDPSEAVRARAELAFAAADRGDRETALSLLSEALTEARSSKDVQAEALAQAKLCACELASGNPGTALEHGWSALHQLDDVRERAALLEQVGIAFAAVGLHKAAERCFTMVAQRGVDSALRARARAAHAAQAAAVGASHVFRDRRIAMLNDVAEWSGDPRVAAFVQLELGRASVLTQDLDFARAHLREAIAVARRHALGDILASAEATFAALETNGLKPMVAAAVRPAADAARRIAEQLDALPDLPLTTP
jgi:tetratricopeptide (TPR) repeat protein